MHTLVDAGYSDACLDVAWSVCLLDLSVCLSVCVGYTAEVNPAKTAEPIEMPFGRKIRVG